MKDIKFFILTLFLTLSFLNTKAQSYTSENNFETKDKTYDTNIKSIILGKDDFTFAQPVIQLRNRDQLTLSFDDFSAEFRQLTYTFIHCNADWTKSDLFETEYMEGFPENYINQYAFSVNTLVPYIHYSMKFPNENVKFTKSGNYMIIVYDGTKENILFGRRFMISDQKILIQGQILRPYTVEDRDAKQLINFNIDYKGLQVINPFTDIKISLLQNFRWDNAISDLTPQFINNTKLIYNYEDKTAFDANDEYRFFDTRTLRTLGLNIRDVLRDSIYRAYVMQDFPRSSLRYVYRQDINGLFYVDTREAMKPEIEGDYCEVNFFLKAPYPYEEGSVFITGALNEWQCNDFNKMHYEQKMGGYVGKMLLKQGIYNYQYALLKDGEKLPDISSIEGSHFETENNYTILVYYRRMGNRYDELIGIKTGSSNGGFR